MELLWTVFPEELMGFIFVEVDLSAADDEALAVGLAALANLCELMRYASFGVSYYWALVA